jgi:sugar phosphate isomerase/epimerase
MKALGIELMCVFGMPPIPYIELVAELDCRYITAVLEPLAYNPYNFPKYSLRTDPALRREMRAALRANEVEISLGEGFVVRADREGAPADPFAPGDGNMRERWAADFDIMAELGIRRVNAVSTDPDLHRSFDQLGVFAELAAARGMESTIEFCPGLGIADLETALAAVRHVGRPDFRLLLDPMHLIRSGGTVADVAALEPDLIGHAQLCDVPLVSTFDSYIDEAMYERLPPGAGELPLLAYLKALPRGISVGLEVPQRSLAEAGVSPLERVKQAVDGARALLAQLDRPETQSAG